MRDFGPAFEMAWVVAFSTLIPLGVGLWIDRRLGTAPLFVLIGAVIGILVATVGAVRVALRSIEALGAKPRQEPEDAVDEDRKGDAA